MNTNVFNVLIWDFNTDSLEHYDVLPYFRDCYNECVKKSKNKNHIDYFNIPKTHDEFKKFIEDRSLYMFWSKCQWEMIIHGWPVRKNNYKIDVHEQIMMNIDIITNILYNEMNS